MQLDLRAGPTRAVPAVALVGVCAGAALLPAAAADEGQILCPYRLATGGWCPGCGCTRALRSMMHVDLVAAFQLNPWMLLVFGQAVAIIGWITAQPNRALDWWGRYDTRVLQANIAVGLAIWATRLATGAIPSPF